MRPSILDRRWGLLPPVLVLLFSMAVFIFDPAAVTRLVWACVNGSLGRPAQFTGSTTLFGVFAATIWAFRPLSTLPKSLP